MASRYDISSSPAPRGCESPLGSGAGKEEISYLLATRVDFGSVKQYTAVVITTDGRAVLFRSEIDDAGAGYHRGAISSHIRAACGHGTRAHVPW